MALPTVDAVTPGTGAGAGPFTISHTNAGDYIVVALCGIDNVDYADTVKFNGVDLAGIGFAEIPGSQWIDAWGLVAPSVGTFNVVVTAGGSLSDLGIGIITFSGVHQTVPVGTAATSTGTGTTPSDNVSSAADELVLDVLNIIHSGSLSVGAGQTSRWNANAANGFIKYAGSTEVGGATTTMSWTNSTSQAYVHLALAIKGAGGGGDPEGPLTGGKLVGGGLLQRGVLIG